MVSQPSVHSFGPVAIMVYVFCHLSFVGDQLKPTSLIPIMISRLVVSLRKAVDSPFAQVWDGDHFTAVGSGELEMLNFADILPPPAAFSPISLKPPFSHGDPKRSSRPGPRSSYLEV